MKFIAIITVLICCVSMFRINRESKIAILILGSMLFSLVNVPAVPLHSANMLLPFSFLLSELKNLKNLIKQTRHTIIWNLTGVSIIMVIITIVTSPHLSDVTNIRYFIQYELFFKYFAILYAFWSFGKDENSIKATLKYTFWGIIILTFFGLLNYITKTADFVGTMLAGAETLYAGDTSLDVNESFTYQDRFRVQSMFVNPFDYGYICLLILILHIYGFTQKKEKKLIFYIVVIGSVFGIVTCGCRTILLCAVIGFCVYMLIAYKLKKKIKYGLFMIFICIGSYQFIPAVQETTDKMLSVFEKNSDVGGSSLEMRTIQYAAVMYHIQDSPLFGCGYNYFNIDLGWGQGKEYLKDSRLAGLEGVVMNYLLERGFCGLIFYLIFYISLITFCYRNKQYSRSIAALGLSILTVYICFANMTGELKSVYPTLLIMGYVIKMIYQKRILQNTKLV